MALLAQGRPAMSPVMAKAGASNGASANNPPAPRAKASRRVAPSSWFMIRSLDSALL
jgi:hypothetical protein